MAPSHITEYRVQFRDTDAAGIMHFSAYFTYMEQAEHEFWRSLGTSVMAEDAEGTLSWPRVAASCDYQRPLRFEEWFQIAVSVERLGTKSVTFLFEFQHQNEAFAVGHITVVCCRVAHGQAPQAVPTPDDLKAKLSAFLRSPSHQGPIVRP